MLRLGHSTHRKGPADETRCSQLSDMTGSGLFLVAKTWAGLSENGDGQREIGGGSEVGMTLADCRRLERQPALGSRSYNTRYGPAPLRPLPPVGIPPVSGLPPLRSADGLGIGRCRRGTIRHVVWGNNSCSNRVASSDLRGYRNRPTTF